MPAGDHGCGGCFDGNGRRRRSLGQVRQGFRCRAVLPVGAVFLWAAVAKEEERRLIRWRRQKQC